MDTAKLLSVLFLCLCLLSCYSGCTTAQLQQAQTSARTATTAALGVLTLAVDHPELVEETKTLLVDAINKVDPKDAPQLVGALAHVNAGNLQTAKTIVATVATAQTLPTK